MSTRGKRRKLTRKKRRETELEKMDEATNEETVFVRSVRRLSTVVLGAAAEPGNNFLPCLHHRDNHAFGLDCTLYNFSFLRPG